MVPIPNEICIMGQAARDWLTSGRRGKALAVVTHTAYLLTEEGELVWLATVGTPRHRRGMQVSSSLPHLTVGSIFTVKGQVIEFESGAHLDFHRSQIWEAPILPVGDLLSRRQLPEKLLAVYEAFLAFKTPDGFGRLIRPLLQIMKNQAVSPIMEHEDLLTRSAWPMLAKIVQDCISHDFAGALQQAEALIGLGPGLTPSGDDFVGGLFFGRYLLSCAYPPFGYWEAGHLNGWMDAIGPRTNLISFTLLKDNALGHAPESLSRFGIALLTNQPPDVAVLAASELTTLGHSTGWDLLTGFLAAMALVLTD